MPKFLNKKEQVYDLELTPYGRFKLGKGNFKPAYYGFYDDNITYDRRYMGPTGSYYADRVARPMEPQNDINSRIKDETQYLGSMVLFRDVDEASKTATFDTQTGEWSTDIDAILLEPAPDIFRTDEMIGSVHFNPSTIKQVAPAWKMVAFEGEMTEITCSYTPSLTPSDAVQYKNIPQVNMTARYTLQVKKGTQVGNYDATETDSIPPQVAYTAQFSDGNVVALVPEDPFVYLEEMNTELLSENFDIEVFHVEKQTYTDPNGNSATRDVLTRKLFESRTSQIQDGFMMSATPASETMREEELTSTNVEYYFNVRTDMDVDQALACKSVEIYNKDSYYIDLDLDCENLGNDDNSYYDIYGSVTEGPVCLE